MSPQTEIEILRAGAGIFILGWVAYCIARGRIGRNPYPPLERAERPLLFWFIIGCIVYVALGVMFDPQFMAKWWGDPV